MSELDRLNALEAENAALKAKAALLEDMAGTFFKGLSAHSPASLSRRYDALTAGVARSPS